MKKITLILPLLLLFGASVMAQKFNARTGTVKFVAESALNDAMAENHQVRVIYDPTTNDFAVSLLVKSFEFEKALMQQHFNADMESEEFPKATFAGKITQPAKIDVSKAGTYEVKLSGDITIHGVTKKMEPTGTMTVKAGKIQFTGKFQINCNDFGVKPRSGVSEKVDISLDATLDPAS